MEKIKIPFSEFLFAFSRSGGAGGQNVNKVNTKVTLYWDPSTTQACSYQVIERFKNRFSRFILDDGRVQITSEASRSQKQNIDDCVEKIHEMINAVAVPPKVRKATKPKRSAVLKRLQTKRKDSDKKRLRSKNHE